MLSKGGAAKRAYTYEMKTENTKDRVRAGRVGKILVIEVYLLKVQLRATVTGIALL